MMKRGVLVCSGKGVRKNIGDYVQSIAARQFAGADSVNVEREGLSRYDGGPTKLIMNGWFMHHPDRFPPSDDLLPLFVSFHVYPRRAEAFFTERTVAYLRRFEPVGCRSTDAVALLGRYGIKGEYTSCLTLTLGRTYRHREMDDPPVFVDPFFRRFKCETRFLQAAVQMIRAVPHALRHLRSVAKLAGKFRVFHSWTGIRILPVRWYYAAEFHRVYAPAFGDNVLCRAEYVTHSVPRRDCPTEDAMFAKADALLRRYERAPYVVTSRLHCALPCIAMETPVWVPLHPDFTTGRYGGNEDLMNVVRFGSDGRLCAPGGKLLGVPPVRTEYRAYAAELARRCEQFMEANADAASGGEAE